MIDVASVASRDTLPLIVHFVLIMKTTARRTLGAARTTAAANTGAMTAQAIADALQTITGIPNNQSLQIHLAYRSHLANTYESVFLVTMSLYFSSSVASHWIRCCFCMSGSRALEKVRRCQELEQGSESTAVKAVESTATAVKTIASKALHKLSRRMGRILPMPTMGRRRRRTTVSSSWTRDMDDDAIDDDGTGRRRRRCTTTRRGL